MSGSTATLLVAVSAPNPGFTDGDWLEMGRADVALGTNKTYAFSFGRKPSGGGYAAMAVATNTYAGGEMALIPINGGTINTAAATSLTRFLISLFKRWPPIFPLPCRGRSDLRDERRK